MGYKCPNCTRYSLVYEDENSAKCQTCGHTVSNTLISGLEYEAIPEGYDHDGIVIDQYRVEFTFSMIVGESSVEGAESVGSSYAYKFERDSAFDMLELEGFEVFPVVDGDENEA